MAPRPPRKAAARARVVAVASATAGLAIVGLLTLPRMQASRDEELVAHRLSRLEAEGPWTRVEPPAPARPARPPSSTTTPSGPGSLPAPAEPLDALEDELRRFHPIGPLGLWLDSIALARHDDECVLPPDVERLLARLELPCERVAASMDATPEGGFRRERWPWAVAQLVLARGVADTLRGDGPAGQAWLARLLRLHVEAGPRPYAGGYGTLRRARPADVRAWIALLDRQEGHEHVMGWMVGTARELVEPDVEPRVRDPTISVLREDAPPWLRDAADAAWFLPATRRERAREALELLDLRERLAGIDACVVGWTRGDGATGGPPDAPALEVTSWRDEVWVDRTHAAVHREADLLVTREVLRLAARLDDVALRPSRCPDWRLVVEEGPRGGTRVRVVGSIEQLAPIVRRLPEYELPPR